MLTRATIQRPDGSTVTVEGGLHAVESLTLNQPPEDSDQLSHDEEVYVAPVMNFDDRQPSHNATGRATARRTARPNAQASSNAHRIGNNGETPYVAPTMNFDAVTAPSAEPTPFVLPEDEYDDEYAYEMERQRWKQEETPYVAPAMKFAKRS